MPRIKPKRNPRVSKIKLLSVSDATSLTAFMKEARKVWRSAHPARKRGRRSLEKEITKALEALWAEDLLTTNPTQGRLIRLVKERLRDCPPSDNTILRFAKPWLSKKAPFLDLSQFSPGLFRWAAAKEPETLRAYPKYLDLMLHLNRVLQALASAALPAGTKFKDLPALLKTDTEFKRRFDKALAEVPDQAEAKAQIASMHRRLEDFIKRSN
jgi:hypothetical protein